MRTRPIAMVKVTHGYNLFVNNVPVVPTEVGKKLTFNRGKAGLKPAKEDADIPEGKRPHLFKKKDDAIAMAHFIGKYVLGYNSDFIRLYVEPVGWSF